MSPDITQQSADFMLPQTVSIETIEAITTELKSLFKEPRVSLTIDGSQVENITIPGLQLIVALEKTMSAAGGNLSICAESAAFSSACTDAGLGNLLKCGDV